jgi:DNA-binding response OmpR family regulator
VTESMRRPRITIVNDSEELLQLAESLLEEDGPYQATTLRAGVTSVEEILATRPDLIIVDIGSAQSAELGQALSRDLERGVAPPVIVTSPTASAELAGHLGARVHHLPKPFTAGALEDLVRDVLSPTV